MKKLMLIAIALVISVNISSCGYMNEEKTIATVEAKERINTKEKSFYLVFTDSDQYKITDQLFYGKFNSSELYGRLKIGRTYEFVTHGYRLPFFSAYKNIESYREIK